MVLGAFCYFEGKEEVRKMGPRETLHRTCKHGLVVQGL